MKRIVFVTKTCERANLGSESARLALVNRFSSFNPAEPQSATWRETWAGETLERQQATGQVGRAERDARIVVEIFRARLSWLSHSIDGYDGSPPAVEDSYSDKPQMVNGNEWPSSRHRCFLREPCPGVPNTYCAPKTSMLPAGHMRTKIKRIAYNVEHMHLEEMAFWVGEGYGYLDVRDLHGRYMDLNCPPWWRAAHCTPGSIFPIHLWLDRKFSC